MYYYPNNQFQYNNSPGMYNMPGYSYTQPQYGTPMPGIAPIGFGGYNMNNGGYYSGQYNNFNPYLIQQQNEIQLKQLQEQENYQINMMKELYKTACNYNGREVTEEGLAYYDQFRYYTQPPVNEVDLSGLTPQEVNNYREISMREAIYDKQQQDVERVGALMDQGRTINGNPNILAKAYRNAKMFEERQKKVPPDIGLMEYLEKYAVDDYYEAMNNEIRKTQNTSQLYNQNDYRSLLERHKNSLFGPALDPNSNIDDQEIRLPNYVSDAQKQERRKRFFETICAQANDVRGII